jgi:RsiW-degrading membrane proteinase PrsW (M82 family)
MSVPNIFLVVAALAPAIALCIYVYKKDRVEKEPLGLLAKLLGAGVLCIFPALLIETALTGINDRFFSGAMYESGGSVYMDTVPYHVYLIMENFVCVALVEEGLKRIAVHILTAKNKHFTSLFDGIIYCVFVSLGFAAAENVSYVFQYGFSTAVVRAFTAVPGHTCFAVIMGYYYSMWHVQKQAQIIETDMRKQGLIGGGFSKFNTRTPNVLSLAFPVLVHGFYDYCCSLSSAFSTVLFYAMLIALYIFCFVRASNVSKDDTSSGKLALGMVFRKYPGVASQLGIEQTPVYAADAFTGENRQPPVGPTAKPMGTQPPYGAQNGTGRPVNPYSNTFSGGSNPYSNREGNK